MSRLARLANRSASIRSIFFGIVFIANLLRLRFYFAPLRPATSSHSNPIYGEGDQAELSLDEASHDLAYQYLVNDQVVAMASSGEAAMAFLVSVEPVSDPAISFQ